MDITKKLEQKVKTTIREYNLFNKKEKILVALSGGKDSAVALHVLKKLGYNVEALHLNLHIGEWSEKNQEAAEELCKLLNVKLHLVDLRKETGYSMCIIGEGIKSKQKLSSCLICGVIKRQLLNKKSRELNAKKIVTGHNLDDEVEVYFMNLLKANTELLWGMGPKSGVTTDKKLVQRVKPLYFVTNAETKEYVDALKLPVVIEKCPYATNSGIRKDVRNMIKELEKYHPQIKKKLIENLQKRIKSKDYKPSGTIQYCEKCGEPSKGKICRSCSLFAELYGF